MRQLVTALTPVIRSSVASVLARSGTSGRREARQEVEDATQTVLLSLFADRGRVLLQWDPERGLSLSAFVSLLAKRETVSLLRSRRRSPWTEDPTLNEDLDRNAVARMGPESETISRDMLENLSVAVRTRLSERGLMMFELLFMRGLPQEEVCAQTNLTPDAVYAWKSRLTRQVKEILAELTRTPPTMPPPALTDSNPGLRDPALETYVRLRRERASTPGGAQGFRPEAPPPAKTEPTRESGVQEKDPPETPGGSLTTPRRRAH